MITTKRLTTDFESLLVSLYLGPMPTGSYLRSVRSLLFTPSSSGLDNHLIISQIRSTSQLPVTVADAKALAVSDGVICDIQLPQEYDGKFEYPVNRYIRDYRFIAVVFVSYTVSIPLNDGIFAIDFELKTQQPKPPVERI